MGAVPTLYAVGLALCLFSGGILNARVRRDTRARLSYFTIYFGLEAACFLFESLIALEWTPFKALWLSLLMVTSLTIAPALWLALQEATGARPTLASVSTRQRLLVIAGAVLTIPLLATTHGGSDFVAPGRTDSTLFESVVHETMFGCLMLFAIQVPIYLRRCRRLLIDRDSDGTRRWLQIPLAIVGTTWVLGVVRTIMGVRSARSEELFAALSATDVAVTVLCAYLLIRAIAVPSRDAFASAPANTEEKQNKYAKSQLDAQTRARIRRKLEGAFELDRIHCDPKLSLSSLCRALNEREHYVSQVINQDLGTNFYELLNRNRVEHAKQLLRQTPELGVLEIAMAVGFNAKSTFNGAFRRLTGLTPREFRAQSQPSAG